MKTFKDLEFKPHPIGNGWRARLFFPNGYGISVVRFRLPSGLCVGGLLVDGYGSYTSNENEWEVAIWRNIGQEWQIAYDTPIADDVIGHLDAEGVSDVMKKIQKLPDFTR